MARKSKRSTTTDADENQDQAAAGVEDRRSQTERDNDEAMARMDKARPTPTQEENDLARVGAIPNDAEKEDHGGEDEVEAIRRQMIARVGSPMPYQNRQVKSED